jgi:hypothetical protein
MRWWALLAKKAKKAKKAPLILLLSLISHIVLRLHCVLGPEKMDRREK